MSLQPTGGCARFACLLGGSSILDGIHGPSARHMPQELYLSFDTPDRSLDTGPNPVACLFGSGVFNMMRSEGGEQGREVLWGLERIKRPIGARLRLPFSFDHPA